jgi:hypothetical protein
MMRLSTPARWFLFGFFCALALVGIVWTVLNSASIGGQYADSPDGKYTVSVYDSRRLVLPDQYVITIEDRATGTVVRRVTIDVPDGEDTKSMRDEANVIQWSPNSGSAVVAIGKEPLLRVFVPPEDN